MHFQSTILTIASAAALASTAPNPAPEGVPIKDRIRITGEVSVPDDYVFDTNQDTSIAEAFPVGKGADYLYKCGTKANRDFNPWACAKLTKYVTMEQGCSDKDGDPFPGDPYKKGKDNRCAADGTTGVTHFRASKFNGDYEAPGNIQKDITGKVGSDACGWLGGRCGEDWHGARLFVLPPGTSGKTVDIEAQSYGMVKIYHT